MDLLLLFVSILMVVVGILGAILPVLPATPLAFFGVLLFKFSDCCTYGWPWVIGFAILTAIVVGLGYYIPIYGAKKTGGSKYGTYGALIGLLIGIFWFPPFGFILGPVIGAFVGELIKNRNNVNGAFKSALGSFLGFVATVGINLIVSGAMLALIISHIGCTIR